MIQQFIDREQELEALEEIYKKERSSLIVIYGRRRIGKTALIKQFIKDKESLYYLADDRPDIVNIKELQKSMGLLLNDNIFGKAELKDWVELFEEFMNRIKKKTVIVIDEFPYLITANKSIPSVFQKIWDENLSKKDVCLLLLGSSISMMEEQVLAYKSPLYGRRSSQIMVKPLKIKYMADFFQNFKLEEIIKIWSLTDGVPLYAMKLDNGVNFESNIRKNIFRTDKILYQEAEFLLKELREPANYFLILKSIAFGRNKYGEVVNFTGLDKTIISKYLDNLIKLHIIKKEFPATQKKELRNAAYIFEDNYFNFWFRFIYPNKQIIEEGKQSVLIENIKDELNVYFSHAFEKACMEFLWDLQDKNILPFKFIRSGRWWHKDREIDILCLNEKTKEIMFVECKWSKLKESETEAILENLKEKAKHVDWNKQKRKEYYCIIAKSFDKKPETDCIFLDLNNIETNLLGKR